MHPDLLSAFNGHPTPIAIPPGFQATFNLNIHKPGESASKKDTLTSLLITYSSFSRDLKCTREGQAGELDAGYGMGHG